MDMPDQVAHPEDRMWFGMGAHHIIPSQSLSVSASGSPARPAGAGPVISNWWVPASALSVIIAAPKISHVGTAPRGVLGVASVRGRVLTVLDSAMFANMSDLMSMRRGSSHSSGLPLSQGIPLQAPSQDAAAVLGVRKVASRRPKAGWISVLDLGPAHHFGVYWPEMSGMRASSDLSQLEGVPLPAYASSAWLDSDGVFGYLLDLDAVVSGLGIGHSGAGTPPPEVHVQQG